MCVREVFRAIKAAGIGMDEVDRIAEILNGYPILPILVAGARTSYLDHLRMQQRWIDISQIDCMAEEELDRKPWLSNRLKTTK